MKSAIFVSDVHLKSLASPSGEAFLSLVKKAQSECDLFVILGDLFDLWVGSGQVFTKRYGPLIEEIKKLKATCRVLYFEGNHDIHLKGFWQNTVGIEVLDGPLKVQYKEMSIWLEHGDEINRDDHGYLFLRWFLRTPPLKLAFKGLPSQVVDWIGNRASRTSRDYTNRLNNKSMEIYRAYSRKLGQREKFDLLVVGHNHIPDDFQFESLAGTSRMINLGSWLGKPSFLKLTDKTNIKMVDII